MITDFFLNLITSIVGFFLGLIPADWVPPDWLAGSAGALTSFVAAAGSMSVWVPIDFAFLCAYSIMSAYIGGGVVKGIRILVSHFTGGGGGAA